MKIIALKETAKNEARTAITPETTKLFIRDGFKVNIEHNIGVDAGFNDEEYVRAGGIVASNTKELLTDADIILKVRPGDLKQESSYIPLIKENAVVIGLLSPYLNKNYLSLLEKSKIITMAMEKMPRITKTQNMDVLSSQSNIAGYRAVIEAAYHFNRGFSMIMTAAGTLIAVKVLVLGVGVAGLAAIATAKRLGAVVFASDIRLSTKEQVESLGAKFLSPPNLTDMEDKSGYAKETTKEMQMNYQEFLSSNIQDFDIIITTAQIPNKPAPILLTKEQLKFLKPGSLIVDMSVATGGNVESSVADEIVTDKGITIIGCADLASRAPYDSSRLYAKNLYNFIKYAVKDNKFDFEDEVVKQLMVFSFTG